MAKSRHMATDPNGVLDSANTARAADKQRMNILDI